MTSYRNIVVVNLREDGQPDLLQVLGENDTIADEVLSTEVQDAVASVPTLKGDVTSLSAQVTGIEGISVTAIEQDIVLIKDATGALNDDVTGLYQATGDLYNQVTAIEGISVTAIEQDILVLYDNTGTNFDLINGVATATGTLESDVAIIFL